MISNEKFSELPTNMQSTILAASINVGMKK